MNKKDDYSLKELIFGLYDVSQQHQKELEGLKKFCDANTRRVEHYDFYVEKEKENNPTLFCSYVPKQNKLQEVASSLRQKIKRLDCDRYLARIIEEEEECIFLSGKGTYPIQVRENREAKKQFYNQARKILTSDFANYMRSENIQINRMNLDTTLYLDTEVIWLYIRKSSTEIPRSLVMYTPSDNTLTVKSAVEIGGQEWVKKVLEIPFPASELNPYHREILENSSLEEKHYVLSYMSPFGRKR